MSFLVFVKQKKKSLWWTPKIYINISVCFLFNVGMEGLIFYFWVVVSEEESQQVAPDFKMSRESRRDFRIQRDENLV